MTCWDVLGIDRTQDRGDIRRAYAARLKATNPEDDSEGFKQLRTAYEEALRYAERGARPSQPVSTPFPEPAPHRPAQSTAPRLQADADADTPPDQIVYRAHAAALHGLQSRLGAESDPSALQVAFLAVIRSPAMGTIDIRSDTEERLAWMLVQHIPKSDPLLDMAIDYFRWDSRDAHRRIPRPVGQVLQRQRDLSQLRAFALRYHTHHKAFKALTAPPRPITIRSRLFFGVKAEDVEAFLTDVVRAYPSIRSNLNAETVAQWQAFLGKPHLPNWGLWGVVLSGPSLILGALFLALVPAESRSLGIFTLLPPAFAVAALAYTLGVDLPQRRWREIQINARAWQRWGWVGTLAGVMLAVALPFGGWWLTAPTAILAGATALWIVIVGEPDARPTRIAWQLRAALGEIYLVAWGLFAACTLPAPQGWRTATMLGAVAVVSAFARMPLYRLWARLSIKMRRGTAFCLALAALTGIVALWIVHAWPEWRPAMVAIVAAIVLAHRAITLSNPGWLFRVRYFGFIVVIVSAPIFGLAVGLAMGGTFLLGWVIVLMAQIGLSQRTPAR